MKSIDKLISSIAQKQNSSNIDKARFILQPETAYPMTSKDNIKRIKEKKR